MNKTSVVRHVLVKRMLLAGAIAFVPLGVASAWQSVAQPANRQASPSQRFDQAQQQQKLRDDLQKSQLQQQLHQSVSDTAKRASANDASALSQSASADKAQRERNRAAQQDLLNREHDAQPLPRVVPKKFPASSQSGG